MTSRLKSIRAGHRSAISRNLRKFEDCQENSEKDELSHILDAIIQKQKVLLNLDQKIVDDTKEDEDIEREILDSDEYAIDLNLKIMKMKKCLRESKSQINPNAQEFQIYQNSSQNHGNEPEIHTSITNVNVPMENIPILNSVNSSCQEIQYSSSTSNQYNKLPRLSLPSFSGDILKWNAFWDSFETAIHTNCTLSNVQKFNYLKSLLHGEALESITGFALTNANYQKAITLLRDRYGQEHKISQRYMQALLEIPPAENNLKSLRQFYDKVEIYVRGLDSLGQSEETYGALLVPILLNKLSPELRKNIAREHRSTKWSLAELRECILCEINVMEAGMHINSLHFDSSHDMPLESTATFFTNAKSKANNYVNVVKNTASTPTKYCVFCHEKTHYASQCKSIVDKETRMKIVKRDRLCFNCLGRHKVTECKSKHSCKLCKKRHHTSLCKSVTADNSSAEQRESGNTATPFVKRNNDTSTCSSTNIATPILHSSLTHAHKSVLLKTAIAAIHSNSASVNANILLDEGAMRSFITESVAEKLNLKTHRTESVQLCGFGAKEKEVRNISTVVIKLETIEGDFIPMEVLVVPEISVPIQTHRNIVAGMTHLTGLRLAHPVDSQESFEISLLIGADFYWEVVLDKIIRGDGPTAVQSRIGFLLSGPAKTQHNNISKVSMMNVMTAHKAEETNLEKFWEIESAGIKEQNKSDCENLKNYMETCINFDGDRYVAKLPWIEDHGPLSDNRNIAFKRTKSVINRLKKEPKLLRLYGDIIRDQEMRGFIEKVEDDSDHQNGKLHYIPHHPVAKDSATTPIRIVFYCSCRASSDLHNLNDCLLKTPPQLNDLSSILLRFRQKQYAVSADIEKAFLNIGLHPEDRDVTRFFWLKDPSDPESSFTTYRFRSVLFFATCSPFILSTTLLKHLQQYQDFVGENLRENLYVDNVLTSFDNKDDLLKFYTESRSILSAANFNLRSWASNCHDLVTRATEDNVKDSDELVKVLEMRWNVKTDTLTFAKQGNFDPENGLITKREVLRQISKIYDPMGIISPVTVRSKMFMQSLWKQQLHWDQILSDEDQKKWLTIKGELEEVVKTEFERFYFRGNDNCDRVSLYVFTDASEKAYGTCAYIVRGSQSTFVMAKNRVSPIKQKLTIPKLELMGALMGAKLAHHLQDTLDCSNIYMWCDRLF